MVDEEEKKKKTFSSRFLSSRRRSELSGRMWEYPRRTTARLQASDRPADSETRGTEPAAVVETVKKKRERDGVLVHELTNGWSRLS